METVEHRDRGGARRTIVDRAKQALTTTERGDRRARMIGLTAIGLGATHLLMPRAVARWLAPARLGGIVRLIGVAELAVGAAILRVRTDARAKHVQRSMTIDAPAEMLYARWRDPQVMTQIMQPLGTVTPDASGQGALRWQVTGPHGRNLEWVTKTVEEQPGKLLRWATVEGTPIGCKGSVEFRQDRPGVGTIVTLHLQLPIGLPHLLPELLIAKALRRFKSLVETAEIPTLEHNPSARASAFVH